MKTLCERVSELERLRKVKEKLELVDTAINTETEKEITCTYINQHYPSCLINMQVPK